MRDKETKAEAGDKPKVDQTPFIEANQKAKSRYGRFNIGIVGGTGVGKSSLVNAVFGRDSAKVGKGLPVTEGVHYYHDESLGIWDFAGFEIGTREAPGEALNRHLDSVSKAPAHEQIAIVWYCLNSRADRLTQADIEMIRGLDERGLAVILVLTKVDWSKNAVTGSYSPPKDVAEFAAWLKAPMDDETKQPIEVPLQRVILTSAHSKNGKGTGHGLGELVKETLALSPDDEKDAFRIAQRLNLTWKKEMATPIIGAAATAAAAAAAIPIPIADAVSLAPIQMTMMGRIAAIYDLELKTMMPTSTLAQIGAQIAGKAAARSFLKLVPGAGSVVNAAVAFALTAATGAGWLRLCEHVHTGKVDIAHIADAWNDYSPTLMAVVKLMAERKVRTAEN